MNVLQLTNKKVDDNKLEAATKKNQSKVAEALLSNNRITHMGIKEMINAKWTSLEILDIHINLIGDLGCKYLSRGTWPKLYQLDLGLNKITDLGVLHLSKAVMPCMARVGLRDNKISSIGAKMLTKGNWKNMEKLYLFNLYGGANRVGYLGVCELCLGDWDDLLFLSIKKNKAEPILEQSCLQLLFSKFGETLQVRI